MKSIPTRLIGFVFLFVMMFNNPFGVSEIQLRDANYILDPTIVKLLEGTILLHSVSEMHGICLNLRIYLRP